MNPSYLVRSLRNDFEWEGKLVARWEVSNDPISDDYTPDDISAEDLFGEWVKVIKGRYTENLIPISWFVQCIEKGTFEFMPFQYQDQGDANFLTYFTWPINKGTGERLNWLSLPVIDKLWDDKHCDKGGFIQQTTGWKPSILQPHVCLDADFPRPFLI